MKATNLLPPGEDRPPPRTEVDEKVNNLFNFLEMVDRAVNHTLRQMIAGGMKENFVEFRDSKGVPCSVVISIGEEQTEAAERFVMARKEL